MPVQRHAALSTAAKQRALSNEFRSRVQVNGPDAALNQFRKVAFAMFGKAAFQTVKGEKFPQLRLTPEQLKVIAEHPGKLGDTVKTLKSQGKISKNWSAANAAKLFAQSARDTLPSKHGGSFTVATVNDNFNSPKTNITRVKADVLLVQEAKNVNARKELSKKAWGVEQNLSSEAKQGSAVLWNKAQVQGGKGGLALGVLHGHKAMLDRYLSYNDVKIDGHTVRMISAHRPPKRFASLWPAFDKHVEAFVKKTQKAGLPMIIGMDSNEPGGPHRLMRDTNLSWKAPGKSIDGFLVSPGIAVEKMWRLPKMTSDHQPLVGKFHFKK